MPKNKILKKNIKNIDVLAPLFESMPDQVIVVDSDCLLIFANRNFFLNGPERFGSVFEAGVDVCNDTKISSIVNRNVWNRVLSNEEFMITEVQKTPKGDNHFQLKFLPILGDKNKVIGAAAFIEDITLLRRAEIDLIENRITLQETQEIAGIARWSFGLDSNIANWDDKFIEIFNINSSIEKNKKNLIEALPPEMKSRIINDIEKNISENISEISFDTSFVVPSGGRKYVHTKARFERDLNQFIGVSYDASEITIAKQSLEIRNKELENTKIAMMNVLEDSQKLELETRTKLLQLSVVLSSMTEALIAVDEKMDIVLINQAAAAILRIAPDEAVGKQVDKVCVFYKGNIKIPNKDYPTKVAMKNSTIVNYSIADNLFIKDQSGEMIPVACTANSLTEDLPVRAVMILRNITKEKEIDTTKSELISLASHQLRTPLSSVNWYSEMLLTGDAGAITEEQKAYLTEIHKGNNRMIELVNSLLNVSRIDLGTLNVEPEEVSLQEIVDGVLADMIVLIKENKLKVDVQIPKEISKYSGDKKMLLIIFQNLISNAVKYTKNSGKVSVIVEKIAKAKTLYGHTFKQDALVFSINDSGIGIPEKDKSKIFSKLYRADNVRGLETDGNGLGLYMVKKMITNIGGAVWFNSEENKGTTFYVAFPAKGMRKKTGTTIFT